MATTLSQPAASESRRDIRRFHAEQYRAFANLAEAFHYNAKLNFDLVAYDQAEGSPESNSCPHLSANSPTNNATTRFENCRSVGNLGRQTRRHDCDSRSQSS